MSYENQNGADYNGFTELHYRQKSLDARVDGMVDDLAEVKSDIKEIRKDYLETKNEVTGVRADIRILQNSVEEMKEIQKIDMVNRRSEESNRIKLKDKAIITGIASVFGAIVSYVIKMF